MFVALTNEQQCRRARSPAFGPWKEQRSCAERAVCRDTEAVAARAWRLTRNTMHWSHGAGWRVTAYRS